MRFYARFLVSSSRRLHKIAPFWSCFDKNLNCQSDKKTKKAEMESKQSYLSQLAGRTQLAFPFCRPSPTFQIFFDTFDPHLCPFFKKPNEKFFKGDLRDEADFSWDIQKTKNAGCKYFPWTPPCSRNVEQTIISSKKKWEICKIKITSVFCRWFLIEIIFISECNLL